MASRTIQTGADVDAAMAFLGRQSRPPMDAEAYFMSKVNEVINTALVEADTNRFNLVKELMDDSDKGSSIAKLRELLGVGLTQ